MIIGTWLRRLALAGSVTAAVVACSNSTSDGTGSKDAGDGDASPNNRITGDGGTCIANCHEGDACSAATQCASGICTAGACVDPNCTDGKRDGTETAVDCGGTCGACADGLACVVGGDCTSGVCNATTKTCAVPTATDGVKNGSETDTDCGDTGVGEDDHAPPCGDGKSCKKASDCANNECGVNDICTPASCMDGIKNGTETGLDCGGECNPCVDGLGCAVNADCTSKSCDLAGTKLCLPPTATDGITNGNETDKDCGSGGTGEKDNAPACPDHDMCVTGADCIDLVCTAGTCAAATCSDGLKNGSETGTDCGNGLITGCAACADGLGCTANSDCTSLSCDTTNDVCLRPTSSDGITNGNETDKDCGSGGTGENDNALPCATGLKCVSHTDCVADGCNYKGICIAEPSCAQHSGGDTCGAGEIDETTNTEETGSAHESCCASLPLPGQATRLDKYEITAGRMREFVNRTGGNIAGFWSSLVAAGANTTAIGQIRSQDVQYLPTANDAPTIGSFKWNDQPTEGSVQQETGLTLGLYTHIGSAIIFSDEPSVLQGCYIGQPGSGSYGHPTYWWDSATMSEQFGAGPHGFTQAQLDEKSLNCVTQMMLVAFCAWDGGHLASSAELNAAWTGTYPWGASPAYTDTSTTTVPGRVNPSYDPGTGTLTTNSGIWSVLMPLNNGAADVTSVNLLAPQYNLTNWNPAYPTIPTSLRYYWPPIDPAQWGNQVDEAYEIAAPGRFTHDVAVSGATGWYDLGGNLIEATSTVAGTDNANRDSLPTVYWNGGSFEGHGEVKNGFTENILTKYGKTGGRCAR
jgi:hypothetical protein